MARSIVANPGKQDSRIYLSLYLFLACLPVLSLFFLPFFQIQAMSVLIASVTFNIIFSSIRNWSNKMRLDQVSYLVRIFASAEKLSRLALPKQEALKQAIQPFKKTKVISSILQSPTGSSEMEIILIYLNFLFLIPIPLVVLPCGSISITRTFLPCTARQALRFILVVVLPTPPF